MPLSSRCVVKVLHLKNRPFCIRTTFGYVVNQKRIRDPAFGFWYPPTPFLLPPRRSTLRRMSNTLPAKTAPAASAPATASASATPATLPPKAQRRLTRAVQVEFLEELARWGNVRAAAARTGLNRASLYRMRRACPRFCALWDAALVLARPQVEEVLADRALNGVTESVFYHGEEVATRTRYDARLLLAHLQRLDRVERTGYVYRSVEGFDAELEELADEREVHIPGAPFSDED